MHIIFKGHVTHTIFNKNETNITIGRLQNKLTTVSAAPYSFQLPVIANIHMDYSGHQLIDILNILMLHIRIKTI